MRKLVTEIPATTEAHTEAALMFGGLINYYCSAIPSFDELLQELDWVIDKAKRTDPELEAAAIRFRSAVITELDSAVVALDRVSDSILPSVKAPGLPSTSQQVTRLGPDLYDSFATEWKERVTDRGDPELCRRVRRRLLGELSMRDWP